MKEIIIAVFSAVLGGGLFAFIEFLITRKDKKKEKKDELSSFIQEQRKVNHKAEADTVRLQLLVLMADYPTQVAEILKVAEHYFKDLHGNWFATDLFKDWLSLNNIAKPEWFIGHIENLNYKGEN